MSEDGTATTQRIVETDLVSVKEVVQFLEKRFYKAKDLFMNAYGQVDGPFERGRLYGKWLEAKTVYENFLEVILWAKTRG